MLESNIESSDVMERAEEFDQKYAQGVLQSVAVAGSTAGSCLCRYIFGLWVATQVATELVSDRVNKHGIFALLVQKTVPASGLATLNVRTGCQPRYRPATAPLVIRIDTS